MVKIGNIESYLENTAYNSGKFNMDYDLSLFDRIIDDRAILRIYGWEPWCLSFGKNQKTDSINFERLNKDGYDSVFRPTGGRAVFHSNELTYSFVCSMQDRDHKQIYKDVHLFFEKVLLKLGIKSDFQKSQAKFGEVYKDPNSASCFASTARHELIIDDKKVVGSAQRIIDGKLLQHGSIPIDESYLEITDYINNIDKVKFRNFLTNQSTNLQAHSEEKLTFEIISKVIKTFDE